MGGPDRTSFPSAPAARPRRERGVRVLLAGVLAGQVLLFATEQLLTLPAAVLGAVALDVWLDRRQGRAAA